MDALAAPLREWEAAETERTEPERKRTYSLRKTLETEIEKLRRQAANADNPRELKCEINAREALFQRFQFHRVSSWRTALRKR